MDALAGPLGVLNAEDMETPSGGLQDAPEAELAATKTARRRASRPTGLQGIVRAGDMLTYHFNDYNGWPGMLATDYREIAL